MSLRISRDIPRTRLGSRHRARLFAAGRNVRNPPGGTCAHPARPGFPRLGVWVCVLYLEGTSTPFQLWQPTHARSFALFAGGFWAAAFWATCYKGLRKKWTHIQANLGLVSPRTYPTFTLAQLEQDCGVLQKE